MTERMRAQEPEELPPLPYPQMPGNDYTGGDMHAYARTAIASRDDEIARLRSLLAEAQRQIAYTPMELLLRIDAALKEQK